VFLRRNIEDYEQKMYIIRRLTPEKEIISSAKIMEEIGMSEKIKRIKMRQLNSDYIGE